MSGEWIAFSSSHCVAVLDNLLTLIIGCEKGNGEITSLNQMHLSSDREQLYDRPYVSYHHHYSDNGAT